MQRLGEFDNKVIIEQHNEPENKHVIWKDPDENKYKEYVDGSWVESDKIATPGSGTDNFPYEYVCPDDFSVTIQYEDWENVESEPYCEIHVDEIDIPAGAKYFYCVNGRKGDYFESAYIELGSGKNILTIDVFPLTDNNKFSGFAFQGWDDGETLIQQASPMTVNFTDILFLGEKKTEPSDESEG